MPQTLKPSTKVKWKSPAGEPHGKVVSFDKLRIVGFD
jgi:hypothetical protein